MKIIQMAVAIAVIASAQAVGTQAVRAQTAADGLAAMQTRLAAVDGYSGVFGLSRAGAIETAATTGHTVEESWRWASVSKLITAILVFQQIDAGTMELDAPIATYLPESSVPNADRITVRQLMAHRSGLAGQSDLPDGRPGDLFQYCRESAAEPGSTFLYNNCDTIVLGRALEAVTGRPYLDLVNAQIGAPLGITLALPDEARVEATMEDGAAETPVWPSGYGPAGGLYGTVADLLKIDTALMAGQLISAGSLETLLKGDPASGYAALSVWSYSPNLGACINETRLVERYGEIGGVQVRNFLLPDLGLALTVYSNDHRTDFGEVWRGEGLSVDLIRAAACGTAPAA